MNRSTSSTGPTSSRRASGDEHTVTGDVAIVADIFRRTCSTAPLSQKQVRISAGLLRSRIQTAFSGRRSIVNTGGGEDRTWTLDEALVSNKWETLPAFSTWNKINYKLTRPLKKKKEKEKKKSPPISKTPVYGSSNYASAGKTRGRWSTQTYWQKEGRDGATLHCQATRH